MDNLSRTPQLLRKLNISRMLSLVASKKDHILMDLHRREVATSKDSLHLDDLILFLNRFHVVNVSTSRIYRQGEHEKKKIRKKEY